MNTQPTKPQEAQDLAKACIFRAQQYWRSQLYFCYSQEIKKAKAWEQLAKDLHRDNFLSKEAQ